MWKHRWSGQLKEVVRLASPSPTSEIEMKLAFVSIARALLSKSLKQENRNNGPTWNELIGLFEMGVLNH
jgi:hypothetical protein